MATAKQITASSRMFSCERLPTSAWAFRCLSQKTLAFYGHKGSDAAPVLQKPKARVTRQVRQCQQQGSERKQEESMLASLQSGEGKGNKCPFLSQQEDGAQAGEHAQTQRERKVQTSPKKEDGVCYAFQKGKVVRNKGL